MKNSIAILAVCTILISGCASSPQSRFYTLAATAPQASGQADTAAPSIAIASVTIPELVDRPQLVIHDEGARVELLETHRWAEPLKSSIPRIIAEDISRILTIDRVSSYPQTASLTADIRIYLDIQRFESAGDHVLLDALWTIRGSDEKTLRSGRSRFNQKINGSGYAAMAEAFSNGLGSISREIAQALKSSWPVKK